MGKVRTVDRTREETLANWRREEAVRRERAASSRAAEARETLRDRAAARERCLLAVGALAGVCLRKVARLLDVGLGTAETRRRVRDVLRAADREDLARHAF